MSDSDGPRIILILDEDPPQTFADVERRAALIKDLARLGRNSRIEVPHRRPITEQSGGAA